MVFKRLRERIPSVDPFHRLLCGDNGYCRTVRSTDDIIFKVVKEGRKFKICGYKLAEITVYTQQREKLTPAGGIEFDQSAGLKFIPLGCYEFPEEELPEDILEDLSKLPEIWQLMQKHIDKHHMCFCNNYSRDTDFARFRLRRYTNILSRYQR